MSTERPDPVATPTPEEASAPSASFAKTPTHWGRRLAAALLATSVLLGAALGWAWRSEAGARWLLGQVPGLQVQGWRGALGDSAMGAEQLRWEHGGAWLEIEGLQIQGLQWRLRPAPQLWARLSLDTLQATRVQWHSGPSTGPSPAPSSLRLPVALQVGQLQVAQVQVDTLPALQQLQASLDLGGPDGGLLRVEALQGHTDRFALQGSASLGSDGPLPLQVQLRAHSLPRPEASDPDSGASAPSASASGAPQTSKTSRASGVSAPPTPWPWQAELTLQGPLAQLEAQAQLQSRGIPSVPSSAPTTSVGPSRATQTAHPSAAAAQPQAHPPSATLKTQLRLFEPWPLGDLQLQAEALDLAALHSAAPSTRLSILAVVHSAGLDRPATGELQVSNRLAGRWDGRRLPLRSLSLKLAGTPSPLRELTLSELSIDWGDERNSAGRWTGQGHYQVGAESPDHTSQAALALDLALADWQPAALGAGGPALRLSGPIHLQLSGLPALGATSAPPADMTGRSDKAGSAHTTASAPPPDSPALSVLAKLQGQLLKAPELLNGRLPPSVTLVLDGQARSDQIALRELSLSADGAHLRWAGTAQRQTLEAGRDGEIATGRTEGATGAAGARGAGSASWQWQVHGELQDVDPRPWWPGLDHPATSSSAHRLNAVLDSQASLPEAALADWRQAWAAWRGQLSLRVPASQWAGVGLQGELNLRQRAATDAGSDPDTAGPQLQAQLQLDDGSVRADWQGQAGKLQLDLPRLPALASWFSLLDAQHWAPKAGRLQAQASLSRSAPNGAWAWHGESHLQALDAGGLQLQDAHLWAHGGLGADAPLQLSLSAGPLHRGEARWHRLAASVDGSLRQHQFALQIDSPLLAPVWLERLSGARPNTGTQLILRGDGHWDGHWGSTADGPADGTPSDTAMAGQRTGRTDGPGEGRQGVARSPRTPTPPVQPSTWAIRLAELRLGAADGSGQAWLGARDLAAQLSWQGDGQLSELRMAPGALQAIGTTLSWTQAHHTPARAGLVAQTVFDGQFAATDVAPLLARAQPDLGWAGDLRLGGRVQLRHQGQLDAQLLIERLGGDLSIDDDGSRGATQRQSLGLNTLRLALDVHQGQWRLTQALRGGYTGSLLSDITVQTEAERWSPAASAPLKGQVDLNVANLSAWAPWLPAGWRLGGQVSSQARLFGRWGAPELAGELSGQALSVRNPLQGIELQDGQLKVSLEGPKARIEQFQFRGGDGRLSLSGEAFFGQNPNLHLTLDAQRFRALNRIDRQLVASGQAVLTMDRDTLALNGLLQVDEGLYDISHGNGPTLAEDVVIAQAEAANTAAASAARTPKRAQVIALQIDLGQKLRLRGHGIDTGLQGTLKLSNPRGKLAGQGTISTVGGNYAAYGQKLSIERGQIIFNGPLNDPRLDIYAIRPNLDVKVGVTITGTALNPRVRLAADTDISDTEKLSWLVMGRAPETLGQADTALLQRAAMALLAGDGQSPTDSLLESIGLSDFSLRQAGEGSTQTTVVSVGKQLTRRWYVGYERSVNATTGTWQLIYRIAQRFTLRAQSGEDSALDLIWTWRWE